MGARRDLRHHAAIRAMFLELRQHEVAEDAPVGGDNRRRRLVATRLDTENDHAKCSLTRAGLTVASPVRWWPHFNKMPADLAHDRSSHPHRHAAAARSRWRRPRWCARASSRRSPALAGPGAVEVVVIRTTGDKILDRPLADIGGKGLFSKEIDEAMLAGAIDLAVHSVKDLPTWLPDGSDAGRRAAARGSARRADRRRSPASPICRMGRSSAPRRRGGRRRCWRAGPICGSCRCAATSTPACASWRWGRSRRRCWRAPGCAGWAWARPASSSMPDEMLPAVGQGAIGVTCREDDSEMRALTAALSDDAAEIEITAERAMLAALDGSCRTPIGGLARAERGGPASARAGRPAGWHAGCSPVSAAVSGRRRRRWARTWEANCGAAPVPASSTMVPGDD